jgi:hypothetical protein
MLNEGKMKLYSLSMLSFGFPGMEINTANWQSFGPAYSSGSVVVAYQGASTRAS